MQGGMPRCMNLHPPNQLHLLCGYTRDNSKGGLRIGHSVLSNRSRHALWIDSFIHRTLGVGSVQFIKAQSSQYYTTSKPTAVHIY